MTEVRHYGCDRVVPGLIHAGECDACGEPACDRCGSGDVLVDANGDGYLCLGCAGRAQERAWERQGER